MHDRHPKRAELNMHSSSRLWSFWY